MSDELSESELQRLFLPLVAKLVVWTYEQGWELTEGEAWRTPEQAAWNAAHGLGIAHSLHTERLAIDLNLFVDGVYRADPAPYKPLGDYWKSLHDLCRWGGDFARVDANHFSLAFGGRA